MARPLAFGEEPIAFWCRHRFAFGQEGRGQEVEQALVWDAGIHMIQII
jgi:hypothetical protein